MSDRATAFVETWISENINAEGYQADGDNSRAKKFASQCLAAAMAEGIPTTEISEAFDDLAAFIAGEIEEANDREVARLAAKDD
jgi:hypothetical protein